MVQKNISVYYGPPPLEPLFHITPQSVIMTKPTTPMAPKTTRTCTVLLTAALLVVVELELEAGALLLLEGFVETGEALETEARDIDVPTAAEVVAMADMAAEDVATGDVAAPDVDVAGAVELPALVAAGVPEPDGGGVNEYERIWRMHDDAEERDLPATMENSGE